MYIYGYCIGIPRRISLVCWKEFLFFAKHLAGAYTFSLDKDHFLWYTFIMTNGPHIIKYSMNHAKIRGNSKNSITGWVRNARHFLTQVAAEFALKNQTITAGTPAKFASTLL